MERSFKELLEQKTAETEAAVYASCLGVPAGGKGLPEDDLRGHELQCKGWRQAAPSPSHDGDVPDARRKGKGDHALYGGH